MAEDSAANRTHEQFALLREQVQKVAPAGPEIAPRHAVARVAVDVSLSHLDRPFDYLVPAALDEAVVTGARVRVRFSGKQVGGYVLDRVDSSDHDGRLGAVAKVVSSEVVLRPDVARTVRSVADRYAGTFADVVRLAVPPRHARVESKATAGVESVALPSLDSASWDVYEGGADLLRSLRGGASPRVCWSAVPEHSHREPVAQAVLATLHSGRGSIVCVPDVGDVEQMSAALDAVLGAGRHVVLTADLGPAARYASFLALARGDVQVVVGTRAAAFAPVHDLGLVAIWDDGHDLHAEQRAPYPHAREVLLTRALETECAVLIAGFARTCEAQQLVETGWCRDLGPSATTRRRAWARVDLLGPDQTERDHGARLPQQAFRLIREGLAVGPVLVQVPRSGYRTALTCRRCRRPARCSTCEGPLHQDAADATPSCRWCGRLAAGWACSHCGGAALRAPVVGDRRTAEEIGRAFPNITVRTSSGETVVSSISDAPAIVVATPGAEPVADGGYAAAVLLDTWVMLGRPDLRTSEESLRRWLNATALVRSAARGGRVAVVGDPGLGVLQALVRADPVGNAVRELADRRTARFPPAVRLATVVGAADDVAALRSVTWPEPAELLGPVPTGDRTTDGQPSSRLIVVVPRHQGPALSRLLQEVQAGRSTRKAPPLRIQVDPVALS